MIHAYNENYLSRAGKTMGSLFDSGLMLMSSADFTRLFLGSTGMGKRQSDVFSRKIR